MPACPDLGCDPTRLLQLGMHQQLRPPRKTRKDGGGSGHEPKATARVCHEFGHTVGFDDGGLTDLSCMDGGGWSGLSSYEINKINGKY